ncbi:MAG: GNAT family N-acetyltransferase [Aggregatilineales bacterium]
MTDTRPEIIIRDGLERDIAACLTLETTNETEYVWQMTIQPNKRGWQVNFRTERLPRSITITHTVDKLRLRQALSPDMCFLFAAHKDDDTPLAFLTMRPHPVYPHAVIKDIVVSADHRRYGIGSRLLNIARRWAAEQQLERILIETQTKNYPGIQFCQKNGFTFCGFNDEYYPNHDIAVYFGQTLR